MLKVDYGYSGKKFKLSPYNTQQEKDMLLLAMHDAETDLDEVLEICNIKKDIYEDLSEHEKVAMLYKLREISVGASLSLVFKCKSCGSQNENTVDIEQIITSSNIENSNILDKFMELTDENIQEFISVDIGELDLDEFDDIKAEIEKSVTRFEFRKPSACQKCTAINHIRINEPSFVLSMMSDDSLISMYQTYNEFVVNGGYSKSDVDTMYPFERTILLSLLEKTKEDLNQ